MKKILFGMMSAALLFTSCSQDEFNLAPKGETATVTINVTSSQMGSRAYSDGKTASTLKYAIYDITDGAPAKVMEDSQNHPMQSTITGLNLISGRTYGFVFWAAAADNDAYTVTFGDSEATLATNYTNITANTEKYDAFYKYMTATINGPTTLTAELRRPFAQINFGTSDYAAAEAANFTVSESKIVISNAYTGMNLLTGAVTGEPVEVAYEYAAVPDYKATPKEMFPYEPQTYDYLAMAYVLADTDQELTTAALYYKGNGSEYDLTVGNVPVQRNYRTNIYGAILTDPVNIQIVTKPEYEGEENLPSDGYTYDEATKTYTVYSADGLKKVYAKYTPGFETMKGVTVELANNIDLRGATWTPIYNSGATFDGKDHIISNFVVDQTDNTNQAAGFFSGGIGTIKNVTFIGANIKGHGKAAVVSGDGMCAHFDNVHVKNSTIVSTIWFDPSIDKYNDGNNIGGITGYLSAESFASVENCSVDGLEINAYRAIGGLIGRVNGGVNGLTVKNNTVSNVTITADMTESNYDGYPRKPEVGEIIGSIVPAGFTIDPSNTFDNVTIKVIQAATPEQQAAFEAALNNAQPGQTITLEPVIYAPITAYDGNKVFRVENVTIDANGATFKGRNRLAMCQSTTIKNANFFNDNGDAVYGNIGGTFEDCTFISTTASGQKTGYASYGDVTFTRCYFEGVNYHASHFDGGSGKAIYNDCTFNGFCAWATPIDVVMNGCIFTVNEVSQYGGGNFWGGADCTNCQFNIFEQSAEGNFVRVYNPSKDYTFTGCTKNGRALTHDMLRVNEDGVTVTIDGDTRILNKK